MAWLLDTGILLRMLNIHDPLHPAVRDAIVLLRRRQEQFIVTVQNVAEFCNVCTRPAESRGGYGWSMERTQQCVEQIEQSARVVTESPASYLEWLRIVRLHKVMGVNVHGARLVAVMNVMGIANLLTLNPKDFRRFTTIRVHTPAEVLSVS